MLMEAVRGREAATSEELSVQAGERLEVLDTSDPTQGKRPRLELDEVRGEGLLDTGAARHRLAVRPQGRRPPSPARRYLVRSLSTGQEGLLPAHVLRPAADLPPSPPAVSDPGSSFRRQAVVRELLETEQEFVRDLRHVLERYMGAASGDRAAPRTVTDSLDGVFGCLPAIARFHADVLLEAVRYYSQEPAGLGRAFLRLERDFDQHVAYCRDEPQAQQLLAQDRQLQDYYEVRTPQPQLRSRLHVQTPKYLYVDNTCVDNMLTVIY